MERKHIAAIRRAVRLQFEQFFATGRVEDISAEGMAQALLALRKDAAVGWGHKILIGLPRDAKGRHPMGFSQRVYDLMRDYFGIDLLNDSEEITDTTREYIRIALSRGALNGLGVDDVVKEMQALVSDLSTKRARAIARTETVGAANKAAVVVANDSGLVLNKTWQAVHDKRTRHDHVLADGKTIAMDEYFKIGGYDMLQPGDRGGKDGKPKVAARELVNCRCVVGFEGVKDGNGRLVRR